MLSLHKLEKRLEECTLQVGEKKQVANANSKCEPVAQNLKGSEQPKT